MPNSSKWIDKANLSRFWDSIKHRFTIYEEQTAELMSKEADFEVSVTNSLPDIAKDAMEAKFGEDIADNVSSWLTEHVDPVGSAVVVDDTLTISGAAADAKAAGDGLNALKQDLNSSNGNHLALKNTVKSVSGYQYASGYQRKAWNFGTNTLVDVNNVLIQFFDGWTPGNVIYLTVPSGVQARFTFLNGTTIKSVISWTSSVLVTDSSDSDNFTVEFKYYNSSAITSPEDIMAKVSIKVENESSLALENVINAGKNRYISNEYGFISAKYIHGAWDYTNHVIVRILNVVISDAISYTSGEKVYFYLLDTAYSYRVTFMSGSTTLATTGWINDAYRYISNTLSGVDSYTVEIKTNNSSNIDNIVEASKALVLRSTSLSPWENGSDITTIGIFEKWATIGDSFSVGRWYEHDGGTLIPVRTSRLAWGSIISRMVGNTFLSLGIGGINTRTWLTADPSSGGGLALALASPAQELYFLCLGINDTSLGSSYIGSVSDIHDSDYTLNADTFYGNYGKIIQQMKNHSPDALFIISELVAWNDSSVKDAFNAAIRGIADHYSIPCINPFDDYFFSSNFYQNYRGYNNGHPTGMTYGGMAMAYNRLISKCIYENPSYFMYYNGVADGGV